jgi:DNA-directed RNA polymerase subunit L
MKVEVIESKADGLTIKLEGSDRAVAELIKEELLKNKDVEFAAVVKEHPEINNVRLIVKSSKSPNTAVKKAIEAAEENLKELESKLPKGAK